MKTVKQMLSALLFTTPTVVFCQIPGSINPVTIHLMISYSAPGTVQKDENGKVLKGFDEFGDPQGGPDYQNSWFIEKVKNEEVTSEESHNEYASKIVTMKYGNKEFLTDLVNVGIITPSAGKSPIANWSIVQVTPTFDDGITVHADDSRYYAIHKQTGEIKDLSYVLMVTDDAMDMPGEFGLAEKTAFKEVIKNDYVKETMSRTTTYLNNWKTGVRVLMDFEGDLDPFSADTIFQGIWTAGEKLTILGKGDDAVPVITQTGGKVDKVSGRGLFFSSGLPDEPLDYSVVEGSVVIGGGKAVVDVRQFLNAGPPF